MAGEFVAMTVTFAVGVSVVSESVDNTIAASKLAVITSDGSAVDI